MRRPTLLHSTLARRMLVLFFLCALLPTSTVAVLSFWEVTEQLREQGVTRLRQASKSTGMAIHERLVTMEQDLRSLRQLVDSDRAAARRQAEALAHRFESVSLTRGNTRFALLGSLAEPPARTPEEVGHLAAGHALLSRVVAPESLGGVRLFLTVPDVELGGLMVGELRQDHLWGLPDLTHTGPDDEVCVLDDALRPLMCTLDASDLPRSAVASHSSGTFDWERGSRTHVASYWSLFLKAKFHAPRLVIVVTTPRAALYAPVSHFKRIFPLILVASLLVILLLSTRQIERSLDPLRRLRDGTRRIANSDFDARVVVESGDEFEQVAASFNSMAEQLGRHFHALDARAEIDRAALEAHDHSRIVAAVLRRVPDLYPCTAVGICVLDPEFGSVAELHAADLRCDRTPTKEMISLSRDEIAELEAADGAIVLTDDESLPGYLQAAAFESAGSIAVAPIRSSAGLLGMIIAAREARESDPEALLQIQTLADQIATALSNLRMLKQIRFLAYYDGLTRLPNRVSFRNQVEEVLTEARREKTSFAVFLVDIDHFKRVNDTLGHAMGDELLQVVADRILESLRCIDVVGRGSDVAEGEVARLGGDEFTILLRRIREPTDAARVARRLQQAFERRFEIGSRELFVSASVGIAVYPFDGLDAETILKNADTAMYHAKEQGRANFQFYTDSMNATALQRLTLETKLRGVVERGELELLYQPVVEIGSGKISGAEALLRWRDPDTGELVAPDEFIPIAEESSLIVTLGEWGLREACRQAAEWHRAGTPLKRIAVNLSGRQLREPSVVSAVERALRDAELDPRHLVLELTETILMERGRDKDVVERLKALGVDLAVDDFGTGYSSLSYLPDLPLDCLKIDKSFVRNIHQNPGAAAVVDAILALSRALDLRTVAEGVESREELEFLRLCGCNSVQGYIFSRPISAEAFGAHLRRGAVLVPLSEPSTEVTEVTEV